MSGASCRIPACEFGEHVIVCGRQASALGVATAQLARWVPGWESVLQRESPSAIVNQGERFEAGMATMSDVACRAGVARATASITLSGKRPVAKVAREGVSAAAKELHYQPTSVARRMRVDRMRTIVLSKPTGRPPRTISKT